MCLLLTVIVGLLTKYFLKYLSYMLLLFQVKTRYPRTGDDGITT